MFQKFILWDLATLLWLSVWLIAVSLMVHFGSYYSQLRCHYSACSLCFQVCISAQRCVFLLNPFSARKWRRRYDLMISLTVWVLVSLACSPFILMRSSSASNASLNITAQNIHNTSVFLADPSKQSPTGTTKPYPPPLGSSLIRLSSMPSPQSTKVGCFKDLPMRRLPMSMAVTMMALAELFGFVIPLACITYSSARITCSLNKKKTEGEQQSVARCRLQSVTSGSDIDRVQDKQTNGDKRRALRMVLSCCAVFMLCFAPYHINFMLYLMVSQDILTHCTTQLVVRQFHPLSLCLASLSCCLNPLLYYFLTAEFRLHLKKRTSSFSSSHLYSPVASPTQRLPLHRLMSEESTFSDRE